MIGKLLILATNKGFMSKASLVSSDIFDYLWMCEIQKWLRDKHDIHCLIQAVYFPTINKDKYLAEIQHKDFENSELQDEDFHLTYEDALEDCLFEALNSI